MFGVDFSELLVILVVALIVVGPERLPKVARTLGMLWARAQRYVNSVKADIARDMAAEEMRQLQLKIQQEAREAEQAMKQGAQSVDQQLHELNSAVAQPPQAATAQQLPPAAEQKNLPVEDGLKK
jgi:sec-independent protein translocase protein TatB